MEKIKVIIKRPDEKVGHVTTINNTLKNLQEIVDGPIESTRAFGKAILLCNEEGKLRQLPRNFRKGIVFPDIIVGTVIVCGEDGEDFGDCPISLNEWKTALKAWGNNIN